MTAGRLAVLFALLLACSGSAVAVAGTGSVPVAAGQPAVGETGGAAGPAEETDGTAVPTAETAPTPGTATLLEAYPNPVATGDPGEFVAVRFESATNTTGWTITDGKTTARLPNRTFEGTVAFSTTPTDAREHTDHPVAALEGRLQLADAGDRLELRAHGETLDEARYRNAPESRIRDFRAGTWRPVGATDLEPRHTGGTEATAFVLPDAAGKTAERLRSADDRLLLAGYTFTSERAAEALVDAQKRGVEVRVLLDGAPVGGASARQARLLDRVTAAGVDVRLLSGPHTRYRHHHPKYAVVDDDALVLTENFKPAGTGGMSSRGWGVTLHDDAAADALADLHRTDREWRAAIPWQHYREGREFSNPDPALGSFDAAHPPEQVAVDSTTVLVAPDNAADALVETLRAADDRILVQQVSIDSRDNRLLRATLAAADRGVSVRIHLADAWYVDDDNAELVAWLNRRAGSEGWDLEAKVDDPDGYEKIHTKGVVVDDEVILGSLNWGRTSKTDNREVAVALSGEEVADYYATVFEDDWAGEERRSLPAGVVGAVVVAVAGALLVARRIRFLGRDGVLDDWQW